MKVWVISHKCEWFLPTGELYGTKELADKIFIESDLDPAYFEVVEVEVTVTEA